MPSSSRWEEEARRLSHDICDKCRLSITHNAPRMRPLLEAALADAERRTWERAIQFIDRLTIPDGWEDGHGWDAVLDYAVTKMREAAQGVLNK